MQQYLAMSVFENVLCRYATLSHFYDIMLLVRVRNPSTSQIRHVENQLCLVMCQINYSDPLYEKFNEDVLWPNKKVSRVTNNAEINDYSFNLIGILREKL